MLIVGIERVLLFARELLEGALALVVDGGIHGPLAARLVLVHKVVARAILAVRDMDVLADEVD